MEGKILKSEPLDEVDSKLKKDDSSLNGTAINVPDSSMDVEKKLVSRYEKFNASSLQRHTSRSSLASIRSKIMVRLEIRTPTVMILCREPQQEILKRLQRSRQSKYSSSFYFVSALPLFLPPIFSTTETLER